MLDWQTVHLGDALTDVAYCVGALLPVEARRTHERDLVRSYHRRLTAQGVDLSWDDCWTQYRRHAFALVTVVLKSALNMDLSGRAVEMFATLAERAGWHALDLESEGLLVM